MEFVQVETQARIAVLRITRPQALNALNAQVLAELKEAFDVLHQDPDVGAVIVTGDGPKAFVAGADIKEMVGIDGMTARTFARRGQQLFRDIETFPKPVIAAINGFALGGGCELALACHIRVASENARFGLPEVGLGLIPGYGGTQRLPRLVGKGLALELILTGDMIDAARAREIGLVNYVTSPENLMATAQTLASKILARGPIAVRLALESVHYGYDMNQEDAERLEAGLFASLAASEDLNEGLSAFIEKRKPEFKGR